MYFTSYIVFIYGIRCLTMNILNNFKNVSVYVIKNLNQKEKNINNI